MMNANREEQLTKYLLHFCYTCKRGHECTTEAMILACMDDKVTAAAPKTPQEETRELLRWYEQV